MRQRLPSAPKPRRHAAALMHPTRRYSERRWSSSARERPSWPWRPSEMRRRLQRSTAWHVRRLTAQRQRERAMSSSLHSARCRRRCVRACVRACVRVCVRAASLPMARLRGLGVRVRRCYLSPQADGAQSPADGHTHGVGATPTTRLERRRIRLRRSRLRWGSARRISAGVGRGRRGPTEHRAVGRAAAAERAHCA